jgi:hypothetical protein
MPPDARRRAALGMLAASALGASLGTAPAAAQGAARVIQVMPGTAVPSLAAAARIARDGDVVEVAPGEYRRDTAVWSQRDLTIRAAAGRVRLVADGASAEDKAIFVVRGARITIENLEFSGARVADGNGAGIRFETGSLLVRNCVFEDNQNGILGSNDPRAELTVEDSTFRRNGAGDGRTHHLYVARSGKLVVRGSYFSEGRIGHLLKSGARETYVLYNRLTDEARGTASYEIDLPYGGMAVVLGNLIQQDRGTENSTIVTFGAEGYRWERNALYVAHNTIVNDRTEGGSFVSARPAKGVEATARVVNNVLVGRGDLDLRVPADTAGNVHVPWSDLAAPTRFDYRLRESAQAARSVNDPGRAGDFPLRPEREYVHPAHSRALPAATRLLPGAFQDTASARSASGAP